MLNDTDLAAADLYLSAQIAAKAAEASLAKAKAVLLASLGICNVGVLPDGRTVRRSTTTVGPAVIERKAYTSTRLDIS
ncbi:MAG: hypothetical protein ACYDCI_00115 [Candidatus Limnocylindrales bacterium]